MTNQNDLDIYKQYTPPGGEGGQFLKLKDGDTFKVRLVSLPAVYQSSFMGSDGKENLSTRYAWVIWNHDLGKAQIWSGVNAATYGQISDLVKDEDYGDHREYDVKISRSGSGPSDTRYSVRPSPNKSALTAEQLQACEAIDPIAAIQKGRGVSYVMWLADYLKAKAEGTSLVQTASPAEDSSPADFVDISDVPF